MSAARHVSFVSRDLGVSVIGCANSSCVVLSRSMFARWPCVFCGFRAQAEAAKAGASKEAKGKKGGDDDD